MPPLCLRKLAWARARRRLLSAIFSEDRGRSRRCALSILPRRCTPLFTPRKVASGNFCGWDARIKGLASFRRHYIKGVDDFVEETSLAVCNAFYLRETKAEAEHRLRGCHLERNFQAKISLS